MSRPIVKLMSRGLCSTAFLRELSALSEGEYMMLQTDPAVEVSLAVSAVARMERVARESDATVVYSDFRLCGDPSVQRCNDYGAGSVRDDFDFGPVVMLRADAVAACLAASETDYEYAGWYALRLALSRMALPVHIPEPLYDVAETSGNEAGGEAQFAYVDPRNRAVQIEMEDAFTRHLKRIGAWLPPRTAEADFGDLFPVEASVIIPVRNRVDTIGDAIFSALDQDADFPFNVIVVDNHSTDGTTEVIRRLADDPRLIHVVPQETTLGIGGCWNKALSHPMCGRFAVQLDSDDVYSGRDSLARIVERFRTDRCAMVVGTYSLTDFSLNPIPPGVIDHREWTDANGHNNLLRINGMGAPRAFSTAIARRLPMPDVSYGEDYAMALRISREYRTGRIFDVLYLCRRWTGNSDAAPSREKMNGFNHYKDTLRGWEISARRLMNNDSRR